jgi:hypothetical protein
MSEFSYGFAIAAELRDSFWPWEVEAPLFPTLRAETQLGWDIRFPTIGSPLFIQFKVAEALTRASAAEWSYYNFPYYRFPLHRVSKSDQHNRLRNLSQSEPFVFYVAPRFHRLEEFNERYLNTTVITESAWISLSGLPAITDDQQHHIAYRTGFDVLFASPEPEPMHKTFDGESWKNYLVHELETRKPEITIETIGQLRTALLDTLKQMRVQHIPELPISVQEGFQVFKDITYLSRTFFGAEFLFIHQQRG